MLKRIVFLIGLCSFYMPIVWAQFDKGEILMGGQLSISGEKSDITTFPKLSLKMDANAGFFPKKNLLFGGQFSISGSQLLWNFDFLPLARIYAKFGLFGELQAGLTLEQQVFLSPSPGANVGIAIGYSAKVKNQFRIETKLGYNRKMGFRILNNNIVALTVGFQYYFIRKKKAIKQKRKLDRADK